MGDAESRAFNPDPNADGPSRESILGLAQVPVQVNSATPAHAINRAVMGT